MSRPHCQKVDACVARGQGHCRACTAKRTGEARLDWLPQDRREQRNQMVAQKIPAAEIRRIIEADMRVSAERAVHKIKADMIARRDRERAQAY